MRYLTKRHATLLLIGCWLVYTAAYIGRLDYSASMVKIIADLGITNDQGGVVYSCFALSYGIGQLINGLLCKYYPPKYVITGALFASALINFLMPLGGDYRVMAGLWLVNGMAQSMLYSLLIRTISLNIKSGSISRAIYTMSTTVAVGTALAYGISALSVALGNWRLTFTVAGICLLLAATAWVVILTRIEKARADGLTEEDDRPATLVSAVRGKRRIGSYMAVALAFIGMTAIVNGFIKDGVNNWLPKLLYDEFGVKESASIILTLLLPLFSVVGALIARRLYLRLQNHLLINGILYGVAFLLALGVFLLYPLRSVLLTMLLFIGLSGMMAAINNVITGMFPLDNRDRMDSGLLAGLLDTLCYLGSTVAGTLLGVFSRSMGWESVLIALFATSLVAALVSLLGRYVLRRCR